LVVPTFPLFQQAYVVSDLERGVNDWSEVLGAGPFAIRAHHRALRFAYRGTPQEADVSYAFGYLGDMMIQLIEQHDDTPSIYRDMYGPGEEGFHHVATLVHDYPAARQYFLDQGFELACELWTVGVDAAYFDTRAMNGGFTEIHGDPEYILETFASWRAAHARHRPGDPAVLQRSEGRSPPPTDPDRLR
jgi:hypothetical protein